jgi:hypothetical protein
MEGTSESHRSHSHRVSPICKFFIVARATDERTDVVSELIIRNAEREFFQNFLFAEDVLPLALSALFGAETSLGTVMDLWRALVANQNFSCYFILYKSNGERIPCHLRLISFTGGPNVRHQETNEVVATEKYGVITLHHTSDMTAGPTIDFDSHVPPGSRNPIMILADTDTQEDLEEAKFAGNMESKNDDDDYEN